MINFIFLITLSLGAKSETIDHACNSSREIAQGKLSWALRSLETRFSSQSSRVDQPQTYMRALERVIRETSFSHLLDCRDQLRNTFQIYYRVNYGYKGDVDKVMSVWVSPRKTLGMRYVEMDFNPYVSWVVGLIGYLHELTHVCQSSYLKNDLDLRDEIGRDEVSGRFWRRAVAAEVKAYFNESKFVLEVASAMPSICKMNVYEGIAVGDYYRSAEYAQKRGYFAQLMVELQLNEFSEKAVLQNDRDYISYTGKQSCFRMRPLHPKLREEVEEAGIFVKED